MLQSPMISCPLKQTNEIDWIQPLKNYIRDAYGFNPEDYAEECATLNRLRQDMRDAGRDSATGRDLLYRYYGQLELLDLRFPVDENHIKVSFTWYDAFTNKATSQYSLAYEKASIIFNMSAVLSCHAANQNRAEDVGLKTAYHSFRAAAGMFTYINENFLHAPSTDLNRDTIKTLIAIMLAQAQEVFLEKQITDDKKPGFLAKLASQAAYIYNQALEGVQENASKGIFEKVWTYVVQAKAAYISSLAGFYQAIADDEGNLHGLAIARLMLAEKQATTAFGWAKSLPSSFPIASNLNADTGSALVEKTRRQQATVKQILDSANKDNDYIYHELVPPEASLSVIAKLPAAKAIPVNELYQGQDIQKIIGPDIFQRIVPMSVTESASLYDEEKAKLVRAETEKVETANGEMAASLDYLKLPGSLSIIKGVADKDLEVDRDFKRWCEELAGHEPFRKVLEDLQEDKVSVVRTLDDCSKQMNMEESVCEKMRTKYGAEWTQQPSSRLTTTLKNDIRSYRETIDQASVNDSQLLVTLRQYDLDFDEMRSAGETDEADVLFQRALIKAEGRVVKIKGHGAPYNGAAEGSLLDDINDEGVPSVPEQVSRVEELLRKLALLKRDRVQTLKDLREKVHTDDISSVLILNKKTIASQETQLFQTELEKFRAHQSRLVQANHKQTALMKELTKVYGDLLQDKRVRAEQARYETITKQRNIVMSKYKKVYNAFCDLSIGVEQARQFYDEMKSTVDNLHKNVDTFVNNRRTEGAQLLSKIERDKQAAVACQEEREREKLSQMMSRLAMEPSPQKPSVPSTSTSKSPVKSSAPQRPPSVPYTASYPGYTSPSITSPIQYGPGQPYPTPEAYNPMAFMYPPPTMSPSTGQQYYPPVTSGYPYQSPQHAIPPYQIPPPPPPPRSSQSPYPAQPSIPLYGIPGYIPGRPMSTAGPQYPPPQAQSHSQHGGPPNDPWAGLNSWK